jgi:hypothetical protein
VRIVQTLPGLPRRSAEREGGSEHGRPILQIQASIRKYNDLGSFMRSAHDPG